MAVVTRGTRKYQESRATRTLASGHKVIILYSAKGERELAECLLCEKEKPSRNMHQGNHSQRNDDPIWCCRPCARKYGFDFS